jgi:hypothetical protein
LGDTVPVTRGTTKARIPGRQLDGLLDLTAGLTAAALLVAYYTGQSGLPRLLLAVGFTFFVPGRAIVSTWPRMAAWSKVAMPVVLSLASLTLLATVSLWAHEWKPTELFEFEAFLSLALLSIGLIQRSRNRDRSASRSATLPGGPGR